MTQKRVPRPHLQAAVVLQTAIQINAAIRFLQKRRDAVEMFDSLELCPRPRVVRFRRCARCLCGHFCALDQLPATPPFQGGQLRRYSPVMIHLQRSKAKTHYRRDATSPVVG